MRSVAFRQALCKHKEVHSLLKIMQMKSYWLDMKPRSTLFLGPGNYAMHLKPTVVYPKTLRENLCQQSYDGILQ